MRTFPALVCLMQAMRNLNCDSVSIGAMVEDGREDGNKSVWLSDGRKLSALCGRHVGQQSTTVLGKQKERDRQDSKCYCSRVAMTNLEARLPCGGS